MRVLFAALHFGYFRNYEPAIVQLAARGHDVHLAADVHDVMGGQALVERLASEHRGVTWGMTPPVDRWPWARAVRQVRHGLECLRFAAPMYDEQLKYRVRSEPKAPRLVRWLSHRPLGRAAGTGLLKAIERGIPAPPVLCEYIASQRPDIVLLASVTNDGAPQMDHLKAAQTVGARTSLPIYSWDHLSGKALLHIAPAQLLVWNRTQAREAETMHRLPADRVVVTGAYGYEQWFDRVPSRSRELFCADCRFDPSRPFVVYVCSVLSRPAPSEAAFVLEWVRALRSAADPRLREIGIVIRPHPERESEWDGVDLSGLGPIALRGRNPIDPSAKADYFDTLYHSSAVVGIITSAFIEAAVVGRPSLTIEDGRFAEHQHGAPHYHYLRDEAHGLLLAAPTLAAHVTQLAAILGGDDDAVRHRTAAFVDAFVRVPDGRRASEQFARAVEALGAELAPAPHAYGTGAARLVAEAWRAAGRMPVVQRLLWNRHDDQVHQHEHDASAQKDAIVGARRERQAEEDRERLERERLKAIRAAEKRSRIDEKERERAALKAESQRQRAERAADKQARTEREARARAAALAARETARRHAATKTAIKQRVAGIRRRLGIGRSDDGDRS
jgi:hypothetical protein